jgi:cytidylate kinase
MFKNLLNSYARRRDQRMKRGLIITVDGPAGAGKSTVSKMLAQLLSYIYLDTGALYRAVAYKFLVDNTAPDDEKALSELLTRMSISLKNKHGTLNVFVNGENVTDKIRNEKIGLLASRISAIALVRASLLSIQRNVGKRGGIVAEGRDMGTVVFPDADYKFYLEASVDVRARRRYNELCMRGSNVDYDEVERDLIVRDRQDREREIAPLKAFDGATIIDSTHMTISEVVEKMMSLIGVRK